MTRGGTGGGEVGGGAGVIAQDARLQAGIGFKPERDGVASRERIRNRDGRDGSIIVINAGAAPGSSGENPEGCIRHGSEAAGEKKRRDNKIFFHFESTESVSKKLAAMCLWLKELAFWFLAPACEAGQRPWTGRFDSVIPIHSGNPSSIPAQPPKKSCCTLLGLFFSHPKSEWARAVTMPNQIFLLINIVSYCLTITNEFIDEAYAPQWCTSFSTGNV